MKILFHWCMSALAVGVAAYIVPGTVVTPIGALLVAVVLGFLNLSIRPILFILTLPITILTLGLFSFILNTLLVLLTDAIVPGFALAGFWSAFLFSIVLTLVNWVFSVWRK